LGGRNNIRPVKHPVNPWRFFSGTVEEEGPKLELVDPNSAGKTAIKWK